MDEDLYTVTQALGKYYNNSQKSKYISKLHPFLYASKSAYEGSMDRYIKEECKLSITKKEFYNFVYKENRRTFAVFIKSIMPYSISLLFQAFVVTRKESVYLVEKKQYVTDYYPDFSISEIIYGQNITIPKNKKWQNVTGIPLNISDMFLALFASGASDNPQNKFDIEGIKITFDVLTIYQILTNRGSCVKIIQNYAKKMTLDIFNNYIELLNEIGSISSLNLYLQTNAFILGIDESLYFKLLPKFEYDSYNMSKTVLENYIADTLEQRLNLIDIIREIILSIDEQYVIDLEGVQN
jgi:hypothetical protein